MASQGISARRGDALLAPHAHQTHVSSLSYRPLNRLPIATHTRTASATSAIKPSVSAPRCARAHFLAPCRAWGTTESHPEAGTSRWEGKPAPPVPATAWGKTAPRLLPPCRAWGTTESTEAGSKDQKPPPPVPANAWGKGGGIISGEPNGCGGGGSCPGDEGGSEEPKETWGFIDWKRYDRKWAVPWGGWTVAGGMVLWLLSFIGTGFLVVPGIYKMLGMDMFGLSPEEKATFTLITQISETVVTLALIRVLTYKHMDEAAEGSADNVFNYSLADPFKRPTGWAVWGGMGVVLSPFIVGLTAYAMSFSGYDAAVEGGRGTADGVAAMISMDMPTYLSLVSVTGVLAPLLEETVFRGFLLTSLTKWVPTWAAVVLSSVMFGAAHVSSRDFPVLVVLGLLLGFSYVRSNNLLTPIIIHGVWNSSVLSLLFYLASVGVDIESMLKEAR